MVTINNTEAAKKWEETRKMLHDKPTAQEFRTPRTYANFEKNVEEALMDDKHDIDEVLGDNDPKPSTVTTLSPVGESSKDLAPANVKKNMGIAGLEEIPLSMLPIPFYKLVQPGSTKVTLNNGQEALPGNFFMGDLAEQTEELNFALLRAKRQHRTGDDGKAITSMGLLCYDLIRMQPFILSLSISSFGGFGKLMAQMNGKGATAAWEYPITLTTTKREEQKNLNGRIQMVKYYVINFNLGNDKLEQGLFDTLSMAYIENASKLDREQEMDEATIGVEVA